MIISLETPHYVPINRDSIRNDSIIYREEERSDGSSSPFTHPNHFIFFSLFLLLQKQECQKYNY